MNMQAKPRIFELDDAQLAHLIKRSELLPQSGSPLGHIRPRPSDKPKTDFEELPPEVLHYLLQPGLAYAVSSWPPEDTPVRWYYGKKGHVEFVQHETLENDRHLIVWPISNHALVEMTCSPIENAEGFVAASNFSLTTDQDGLKLLAALCDAMQELQLQDLLKRRQFSDTPFSSDDLRMSLKQTLASHDIRWMGERLSRLSPMPFSNIPESFAAQLDSFIKDRLIRQEGSGYRPTPPVLSTCTRWNADGSYTAITRRVKNKDNKWDWNHEAIVKAVGGVFSFSYDDISMDKYKVTVRETDALDLKTTIESFLTVTSDVVSAQQVMSESSAGICEACGSKLRPGSSFCTHCGAPITPDAPERQTEPTNTPEKHACPRCGNDLKPNAKFCSHCGAKLSAIA